MKPRTGVTYTPLDSLSFDFSGGDAKLLLNSPIGSPATESLLMDGERVLMPPRP